MRQLASFGSSLHAFSLHVLSPHQRDRAPPLQRTPLKATTRPRRDHHHHRCGSHRRHPHRLRPGCRRQRSWILRSSIQCGIGAPAWRHVVVPGVSRSCGASSSSASSSDRCPRPTMDALMRRHGRDRPSAMPSTVLYKRVGFENPHGWRAHRVGVLRWNACPHKANTLFNCVPCNARSQMKRGSGRTGHRKCGRRRRPLLPPTARPRWSRSAATPARGPHPCASSSSAHRRPNTARRRRIS